MRGICENVVKYALFLSNLLVCLGACVVFGFSIYALVDEDAQKKVFDLDILQEIGVSGFTANSQTAEIAVAVASGIVVIVSFLGCCGAIKENRFILFIYFTIVLIATVVVTAGAALATSDTVQDGIKIPLARSLEKYDPSKTDEATKAITQAWDEVQEEFLCCGIDSYQDWSNDTLNGPFPMNGDQVPKSCCTELDEGVSEDDCLKNPGTAFDEDSSRLRGCYEIFKKSYEANEQTILIILSIVVAIMVFNLVMLFAFALCINPYERS